MSKFVVVIVAVLVFAGSLVAAHAVNAEIQSVKAGASPASAATAAESGAVVQAYYHALNSKNLPLALPLLSDTVELHMSQPYGDGTLEYIGIEAVQNYLEADMQRIFSLLIRDMSVNGDRVEFSVTEWLNPRIVGPSGPFPVVNRYVAIVRDGQIQSLVQRPLD